MCFLSEYYNTVLLKDKKETDFRIYFQSELRFIANALFSFGINSLVLFSYILSCYQLTL